MVKNPDFQEPTSPEQDPNAQPGQDPNAQPQGDPGQVNDDPNQPQPPEQTG